MALRLIEVQLPKNREQETRVFLKEFEDSSVWEFAYSGEMFFAKIVIPAEQTEKLMDLFEKKYSGSKEFRLNLHSLEAMLPRQEEKVVSEDTIKEKKRELQRVSREELYHDIEDACKLNYVYVVMVFLSAVVASIGIMKQNIPAIIGSMVIAPLLGPNVALSFAATLGDLKLAAKALKINIAGILTALFTSIVIGWFFNVYIKTNADLLKLSVDITDVLLALSAGAAGALAFTTGLPAILIGVMVAVALLPPLVSFGLFVGAGMYSSAWTAFLLVIANIVAINISGIVTFYFQNIRALTWWEEGKAKKFRLIALMIWLALLAILVFLIYSLKINIDVG